MKNLLEKAHDIKIIFFDIDDTLRVKNTGLLPESVAVAFDRLRARGIYTGIATGRNLSGVVPEVRALGADFYVTANGSYVEDRDHQVIYNHPLPRQTVEALVDWCRSVGSDWIFYGRDGLACSRWTPLVADAIRVIYGELPVAPDYHETHEVYQLLSISDHDDAISLPDGLADKVRRVRWHPHSSDIVPVTGSKADGVARVLERLGLTADQLMNFGDGPNDAELFDYAGLSVAMAVSSPEILSRADYVTDTVEADGVMKALQKLEIL